MFFVGIFSSQIATILIYLAIFLYFSLSLASHEMPQNLPLIFSTEKQIVFEEKINTEHFTIFSFAKEKNQKTEKPSFYKLIEFSLCRLKNNNHKQILESKLIYSYHPENSIFNRPPPCA